MNSDVDIIDPIEAPVPIGRPDETSVPGLPNPPERPKADDARAVEAPGHHQVTPGERPRNLQATAAVFTDERMLRPQSRPPANGWRRAVYRSTFGLVNPGPSPAEIRKRERVARIKAPIHGSRRIAVISRKGGVGKTTTALLLGHTLASWRGDRVVALDANPDAGSLAYRVHRETSATITTLLAERDRIERYADVRAYTSQAPTRLEVIAGDNDPAITQALTDRDYRRATDVLDRHYNLILLDTGTGILDSGIQGILREADQVVVVMPPALDGARVAASTLDWLEEHGYVHLVRSAVAVINAVRPSKGLVEVDRLEEHFAARCAAVVRIPWDPHLEAGSRVTLSDIRPLTGQAYLEAAAAIADSFNAPGRAQRGS